MAQCSRDSERLASFFFMKNTNIFYSNLDFNDSYTNDRDCVGIMSQLSSNPICLACEPVELQF